MPPCFLLPWILIILVPLLPVSCALTCRGACFLRVLCALAFSPSDKVKRPHHSALREFLLLHASVGDVVEAHYVQLGKEGNATMDIKVCWALDASSIMDDFFTMWGSRRSSDPRYAWCDFTLFKSR
jgi:hypothetical protein